MTYFITVVLCCCLVGFMFFVLMNIRNHVVYKARTEAINIVYQKDGKWLERVHLYDNAASYDEMMWQFTKWKVGHFFPELVKGSGQ